MYRKEILIVLKNVKQLNKFKANGVTCAPILNNGNYLLPLGWEDELNERNVKFEIKEVEIFEEETI
jgi:hypothetical protein